MEMKIINVLGGVETLGIFAEGFGDSGRKERDGGKTRSDSLKAGICPTGYTNFGILHMASLVRRGAFSPNLNGCK
jgi:hypothetical protein